MCGEYISGAASQRVWPLLPPERSRLAQNGKGAERRARPLMRFAYPLTLTANDQTGPLASVRRARYRRFAAARQAEGALKAESRRNPGLTAQDRLSMEEDRPHMKDRLFHPLIIHGFFMATSIFRPPFCPDRPILPFGARLIPR